MADVVAKAMAVIMGVLFVLVLAILVVTSRPSSGTREVVAEFRDAFPAIEGMQVRTDGANAGSTGKISVTGQGLASITLQVDKAVPAPRSDATATIRQLDSTGDSYIAYDPGKSSRPLAERDGDPTIACDAPAPTSPCTNTLASARLDDLVNAFGPAEQAGVKLILQNLSEALEQRGEDVNRAALRLVPALDGANKALDEVNGQNRALSSMIVDLEAVSGQASSRRVQLGRLIGSLDRTLATTAAVRPQLDAGLRGLPATQDRLRGTLAGVERAATAARPLATDLATAAPGLRTLLERAPGFLDDVREALRDGRPTLELTRRLLVAGAPTIAADPQRVVTGSFDLAPALSNLLKGILGGDDTIKAFFGDERNGGAEDRPGFGFGLGAVASEPGDQPGYPGNWQDRNFVRVSAILNCQAFGAPIRPGCLADLLAAREKRSRQPKEREPDRPQPQPSSPGLPQLPTPELPDLPKALVILLPSLSDIPILSKTLDELPRLLPSLDLRPGGAGAGGGDGGSEVKSLLDFLLK